MATTQGEFVWYELMTSDATAATAFYETVIGWRGQDAGLPDRRYLVLHAGDVPVGGLMELPEAARDAGARPFWMGYIAVDDVDAMAARIIAAAGSVHRAPDDIPGVGRFAVVADPHGAVFTIFRASAGVPPAVPAGTLGHVGWHELYADNWQTAFAFYADLFGWTKTEAIDMGLMGTYQLFAAGGPAIGGMMTRVPPIPKAMWGYYFNVDAIEAAVARVKAGGGQLLNGPHQVPGGSWIAQCLDPQGASFAMVAAGAADASH